MDSNARSTICHNTGKPLEKFIAGNQLYIINKDSPMRTFQSSRGTSNIYVTIVNNPMLADIIHWEIAEEESVSDHNLLKFSINLERDKTNLSNSPRTTVHNKGTTEHRIL